MSAKNRLKEYLEYKGINPNQFYNNTGLSNGFLDSGQGINSEKIGIIIEKYPDLNLTWLILNKGSMIKNKLSEPISVEGKKQNYNITSSDFWSIIQEKDNKIEKLYEKIENMREEIGRLKEQKEIFQKHNELFHKSDVSQCKLNK
jgi:hypothetical protein